MDSPRPLVYEEFRRLDVVNQLPGKETSDYTDSTSIFQ